MLVSNMPDVTRVRVVVGGRVQGVGFRYATYQRAVSMGIAGWVRNLPSGEVEVEAQAAPGDIDDFVAWLRVGPRSAIVRTVHVERTLVDPALDVFSIR